MSERRRMIVLALLTGLHAAAAVFLAPVDFLEPESYSGYAKFAVVGFFLVPPALLAMCAVFGPWPIAVRLPLATWLACALALLLAFGVWRGEYGNGLASDPSEFAASCFGGPVVQFLTLLSPLALLRGLRRWRLEVPIATPPDASATDLISSPSLGCPSGQYTLRALIGWTLAAASIFAGMRCLFAGQGSATDGRNEVLTEGVAQGVLSGLMFALAALPVLSLAWLLLASGRRLVMRPVLGVITTGGVAAVLAWFWETDHDIRSLLAISSFETGVIAVGAASLAVLRGCGYRLVRHPRGAAPEPQPLAPPAAKQQRQFACTLASLAIAAIAVACCIPARLVVWRQVVETRGWAEAGFDVLFDDEDGRLTYIRGAVDGLSDKELGFFAELPDLTTIQFEGLLDSQLGVVAAPAGLEDLRINDSGFTDKGLEHLGRFTQLNCLDLSRTRITSAALARIAALRRLTSLQLSLTDISDDGLAALAECKQLRWIDLTLTAVTAAGASRLSAALPEATIVIGACDATVQSTVLDDSGTVRRERLHAQGKYQSFGPGIIAPMPGSGSVSDAGLKMLTASKELKELDLRDSAVTDAGLPAIFGLMTLQRIDLRDTAVTEAGCQQLASALPGCEILR